MKFSVRMCQGIHLSGIFNDQEFDAESNLYNYNARLYDPFIGRFISPDTIVPETERLKESDNYAYRYKMNSEIPVHPLALSFLKNLNLKGYRQMQKPNRTVLNVTHSWLTLKIKMSHQKT